MDELFIFATWSLEALAGRYGSAERVMHREDWLIEQGVLDNKSDEGGLRLIELEGAVK